MVHAIAARRHSLAVFAVTTRVTAGWRFVVGKVSIIACVMTFPRFPTRWPYGRRTRATIRDHPGTGAATNRARVQCYLQDASTCVELTLSHNSFFGLPVNLDARFTR